MKCVFTFNWLILLVFILTSYSMSNVEGDTSPSNEGSVEGKQTENIDNTWIENDEISVAVSIQSTEEGDMLIEGSSEEDCSKIYSGEYEFLNGYDEQYLGIQGFAVAKEVENNTNSGMYVM